MVLAAGAVVLVVAVRRHSHRRRLAYERAVVGWPGPPLPAR
jgi:hypothetical protein